MKAQLRDGRTLVLRRCRESDWRALYEMEVALLRDGRGQVRLESDLGSPERFEQRMLGKLERDVWLLAELEGRVVAEGSVDRLGPQLVRHVGVLAVGVHPATQGLGIGRAIMDALTERAVRVGVVRLELAVRSDNVRAIALYRSLGFEREAVRKRFLRLVDGSELDDWSMVRFLD